MLVDTAGRLHTRQPDERTQKIKAHRVARSAWRSAEVLLVLDSTVGQNGLAQAREFTNAAGVNGIVLTKRRHGQRAAWRSRSANDLKLPIRYVGVGEGIDDLVVFDPQECVDGLFEDKW